MHDIINQNINIFTKKIIEEISEENKVINENLEKIINENILLFLKSSFEDIFTKQKTIRKREAMNIFINKKEEKNKVDKKIRKQKNKEKKQKIQLIPLNGDLKGFYLYSGTNILLIRNGNEKYSAIASYSNEAVKSLNIEDIDFCNKNNVEILDYNLYLSSQDN